MILKGLKVLDVQRVGNLDTGVQAGISEENLPFVFELVSNRLYSNPIGSIVREITSNCFDSHIEAGVDDPVVINKGYDAEEGYYIEFQDFGVGMSPDTMNNIYVNYFSSTKRDSNEQIGAFGLGSKTPLAYTDFFYIITRFDGIEYCYIYHKGESKPTLELLTQEPTDKRNGTSIKIVMEPSDTSNFRTELVKQLLYFDNVYFDNWNINNDYAIYEGKYFKFRSDIDQLRTPLHICIGKVKYDIDFNKVKTEQENYWNIPIAVKFEIGELQMTPSREDIRYDDESIKLVEERIKLAVNEIVELYHAKNPVVETLQEYDQSSYNNANIVFNKEKNHALNLWARSTLSKQSKFKPLVDIGIKKMPKELFTMWRVVGEIYGGVYKEKTYHNTVYNKTIWEKPSRYVILRDGDKTSMYTSLKIGQDIGAVLVVKKQKMNEELFYTISVSLGLNNAKLEKNKSRIVYQYNKIIDKMVYDNGTLYEDYRPTDEWINKYKKSQREATAAWLRKRNKEVFIRTFPGYNGKTVKVHELNSRTGIMVYGFKEDRLLLGNIYNLVDNGCKTVQSKGGYLKKEAFMVIQISKGIEKDIVGAKKTIYCKDFLETKFARRIYWGRWLHNMIDEVGITTIKRYFIKDISKDIDDAKGIAYSLCKSMYNINFSIFSSDTKIDPKIEKLGNSLIKKYGKLKMPFEDSIGHVAGGDEEEYAQYLKSKKYRLKNKFYLKSERQLKYEAGVKQILDEIKNPKQYLLLTFKNETEDGNINEESSN